MNATNLIQVNPNSFIHRSNHGIRLNRMFTMLAPFCGPCAAKCNAVEPLAILFVHLSTQLTKKKHNMKTWMWDALQMQWDQD